ncbi:bifunctional diaminohydroxyphosphoribosylaminopyrimidine deaminase/5-amino-6-(5-phosphoribosylamino)uracil reductase RibD [Rathayibacter sp. ZW T2_19]|uniref:Riboflavin biosynthesis protein RibD n=1 Tax=Rathayibacter rubneri TaxID=2950106 RepID=A0A9X2IUK4_9MICO|nr:bifunctional diaminohydroxyphosphoribosylaminopyrimidine deaminase/5-amino-6-(5-phosphoribosylamino)uracil reductase RibD [Rathayibacter rubneri]MCM6764187.1 bifunctional diaminohydroxyphosphoribosylaminopyrimidine deaminase/5-amino-6-(5-phosphoribosylamino)uracil reductase RibD [Rathayibacter rubneri]
MTIDFEHAMRRALAIAERGPARGVNPRVGCNLLAPDGTVLSEGWHHGAGTAHAEVDALSKLSPGVAAGATAVVSLEPCDHTGRTGPCSRALIEAGVARVVYAVNDPGSRSGGGGDTLRAAGIEVIEGVLAEEGEEFLHVWLTAARRHRPFVTLKWASTLDGRTAAADGSSRWITGASARQRVHEQRAASDAILVGTGTVLADDHGDRLVLEELASVAAGREARVVGTRAIPEDAHVLHHPHPALLERHHDLEAVLDRLYESEVRHVYVEGGPTLASALVAAGLVDEYLVYLAPALLGGPRLALDDIGVSGIADARRLRIHSVEVLGDDLLVTARPVAQPAGGAGEPARLPHALQMETH